ncbi:MAG: trehalase family glycosidase [Mucilaginibacter sp.]
MLTLDGLQTKATDALSYIDKKWDALTGNARDGHHDNIADWLALAENSADGHLDDCAVPHILYLPNDFIYPGGRFIVQFYWDSYFINLSLISSKRFTLAKGMVDNCFYLLNRYGMVIANRKRWAAGSQLPFLALMVKDIYYVSKDKQWLGNALDFVQKEYYGYWSNPFHLAYRDLTRYHAPPYFPAEHIPDITIDNEATWDMSPRFERKDVLELLPVDLNCNMYAYELILHELYQEIECNSASNIWRRRSESRKAAINELMWDEKDGLYYDFNYIEGKRKKIRSLVTFFPLFFGVSDSDQARRVKDNLYLFETSYGLSTCDHDYSLKNCQWSYPIGWAPLHWIVYIGLKNYGYLEDARRIALKWLNLNYSIWRHTGKFFEKYDVITGSHHINVETRYKNQHGFGWTNAVFHILVEDLLQR